MKVIVRMSEWIGRVVSWLTLLMVLTMTLVVVLRYGFNLGWIALQESVLYMHAFVLMLGMASVLNQDQHVRVDIFYSKFKPKNQHLVNIIGHLVFLIPTCLFIIYISFDYVSQSWQFLEGSQEAGGIPLVYLLKSLILLMPTLLILQALAETLVNVQKLKSTQGEH